MPNFAEANAETNVKTIAEPVARERPVIQEEPSVRHECIIHAVRGPERADFWREIERRDDVPHILLPFLRRNDPSDKSSWGKVPVGMWGCSLKEWQSVLEFAETLEHWNPEDPQLMIRILKEK